MKNRAGDWLAQAEEEFAWAKDAYSVKRWASVCFTIRYPDAFPTGAPFEYFVERQAREALGFARAFLDRARSEIDVPE
jgi:HEPN domain-containing protein